MRIFFASVMLPTGAWCIGQERPLGSRETEVYSGRVILKTLKIVFAASRQALGSCGSAKG